MKKYGTREMVLAALGIALVYITTMFIKLPNSIGGYLNLGDGFILLFAGFLHPFTAFLVGGLGSALADLTGGYGTYAIATLIIKEKVMTHGKQLAKSDFTVDLDGEDCHTNVISRSVAREDSKQVFLARINGNNRCYGHSECDAIIMDHGVVAAIPEVTANCVDASLVHEAAIGKIAGEQLTKLMTLGLTEKEAEEQIVKGFLK